MVDVNDGATESQVEKHLREGVPEVSTDAAITVRSESGWETTYPATVTGLRNAIAALTSNPETLEIPGGTFDLGTTGETIPEFTTIEGAGKRRTQIKAGDGVGTLLTVGNEFTLEGVSLRRKNPGSATADDTAVVGDSTTNGFARIFDNEFQGWWRGLDFDAYPNTWVKNNVWASFQTGTNQGACVYLDDASGSNVDHWIKDNMFGPNNQVPVVVSTADKVRVNGNTFEGNDASTVLDLSYGNRTAVKNNMVSTAGTHGDFIVAGTNFEGQIEGNDIKGGGSPTGNAILVQSDATSAQVSDNRVEGYTSISGIRVEIPAVISDNEVIGCGYAGIFVVGSDATIEGNRCKNNDQAAANTWYSAGIALDAVTDCSVTGNRCYDDQGTKTQEYGVSGDGNNDYNSITGNTLRGNATAATNNLGANSLTAANVQ